MNNAEPVNLGNFHGAWPDQYTRAAGACKKFREYFFYILAICVPVQLLVDGGMVNIANVLAVFFTSLITAGIVIRASVVRLAPLPCLIVMSFNVATLSGALVVQTLDFKPLIYSLKVPEYTFPVLILFQIGLLVALICFINIGLFFKISKVVNSVMHVPLGLMRAPLPLQVWIMGGMGLIAMVLSIDFDHSVKFGDSGAKFIPGFIYLAFAPFLLPALPYFYANDKKYSSIKSHYKFLLPYLSVLVVIGISANTRGGFAGPITNLFLIMTLLLLLGQFLITRAVRKLLLIGAAAVILGSVVISDLAVAMLVVRAERDHSTAVQLVSKTFDAFQNKKELKAYQKYQDTLADLGDYDEKYISNLFLGRLVVTKFADNMLSLNFVSSGQRAGFVWEMTEKTLIALFPTPVLRFFGSKLDKEDLRFSIGDVLYAAQYGTNIGTNNYKLGSSVAHGMALMGAISCFAIIPMFLMLFTAMQSLTSLKNNMIIMSPVVLMQLITLYYIPVGDSYFAPIQFLLRTFPQNILIYILAFHFALLIADFMLFIFKRQKNLAGH